MDVSVKEPAIPLPDGRLRHRIFFPAKPGAVSMDQLTDADRRMLCKITSGRRAVVDVGTFLGGSAEALLSGMPNDGNLISVDSYRGIRMAPGMATHEIPRADVMEYVLGRLGEYSDRIAIVAGDNKLIASLMAKKSVDLVFIDAAHDYENVKADIAAWLPAVKDDGIIAGHDFERVVVERMTWEQIVERSYLEWDRETGCHFGVIRAVQESFTRIEVSEDHDSSIWVSRPEWRKV